MKYKIVFIDWFRTLSSSMFFVSEKNEDLALCKYYRHLIFEKNDENIEKWLIGKMSAKEVISAAVKDDKECKTAFSLLKTSCQQMNFDKECYLPLIQKIRDKGVKVVIATDNMDVFTDFTVPALNLRSHFDEIISSNLCGCKKMDIEKGQLVFFDAYLKKQGLTYDDALLIDDSVATSISSQKCGLPFFAVKKAEDVEYILTKLADSK